VVRNPSSPPDPPSPQTSNLFEAIGGSSTCRKLSVAFYARVAKDPTLRPLFPGKTFKCAIEEFAAFLAQFLGGPAEDAQRRWWLSLRESHLRFKIGPKERDAWLRNMKEAFDDVGMKEPLRSALHELFEQSSAYVVNTGQPVSVVERRIEPSGGGIHREIGRRWDQQRALDEAIAAVRAGELDCVVALAGSVDLQACFESNRSVFANFVGMLIGSGHSALSDHAQRTLLANPGLAHERYSGRTLLHAAAAAGNLTIVELLLHLGVDANTKDAGGHTPLYCTGNECPSGASVVRALVKAGASVDACDGVKHCTPLHMAARRGNVEVSEALLDCGAQIEARDSLGDTPLRRAVNCGRTGVAALLLARGADLHSPGSKGLTPLSSARAGSMSNLLRTWAGQ
jgi:truncated hemoglobin YjbI